MMNFESLAPVEESGQVRQNLECFVTVWDDSLFCSVTEWFRANPTMVTLFFPPYSVLLNPIHYFPMMGHNEFLVYRNVNKQLKKYVINKNDHRTKYTNVTLTSIMQIIL